MHFRVKTVRRWLIVFVAVFVLSYVTLLFPTQTASAAFNSSDNALINQYEKLLQIQAVADCLYSPGIAQSLETTSTNDTLEQIRPHDFAFGHNGGGGGNPNCVDPSLAHNNLIDPKVGALFGSTDPTGVVPVVNFFKGLGYVMVTSGQYAGIRLTRIVNGTTISEQAIQQKFLDLNNNGQYPNSNTDDMKRAKMLYPIQTYCQLDYVGITSNLGDTYLAKINAAKAKSQYSGDSKYYVLVDEIDSSGAIVSNLYTLGLTSAAKGAQNTSGTTGGYTIPQCYDSIDAYSASNRAIATAAQKAYQQQQIDAAVAVLNATLCTRADYTGANGVFVQQGYDYCVSNVKAAYTLCSASDVSGVPTPDKIRSCLINSLPDKAARINAALVNAAVDAANGVTKPTTEATSAVTGNLNGGSGAEVVCTGGPLGWIICPVASLMNDINKDVAGKIEEMLQTKVMTDPIAKAPIQSIWSVLVGVANLLLVVAFLVVIFSQATSFGLSAYGIKKMLPRIIAAAILINLSFWLCGIAIDIINVVGASVKGIVNVGISAVNPPGGAVAFSDFGQGVLNTVGALMGIIGIAGVTLGIVLATGSIAFIFPVLLGGTAMLVITFLGIALREVLIIMLIIVSPLAFAAMILPNTEPYFKKWYQSFFKLLIMYPVIAGIMYGSMLVATIILAGGNV